MGANTDEKGSGTEALQKNAYPANTTESIGTGFNPDLKTLILWIYNINQNGTSNVFLEETCRLFTCDNSGGPQFKDLSPEFLTELLTGFSTAKEIKIPALGIRLILLIVNCNQNGVDNSAQDQAQAQAQGNDDATIGPINIRNVNQNGVGNTVNF